MDTKGTGNKMSSETHEVETLCGQLTWTVRACDLGHLHLVLFLDGEAMAEIELTPEEASRIAGMLLDGAQRIFRERGPGWTPKESK
jgi:hypothetical protein